MTLTQEAAKLQVQTWINSDKLVVFSKSWCPYCNDVKKLFDQNDINDYTIIEFDKIQNGREYQ